MNLPRKLLIVGLLTILPCLGTSCVSNERYESASTELENQDSVIRKLRQELTSSKSEITRITSRYELAEVELGRLRRRASAADDVGGLRAELARMRKKFSNLDKDIQIRNTPEGPAFSLAGNLAFKTASEEISDRGRELLLQIAKRVATTGKKIRVEGHSDNVPILRQRSRFPRGNLELSGSRALNVADFLITKGGLSRDRVSYAGYGAERPVSDNNSETGRRKNRRVDIVILNQK
ncbi:MAG: OmpA family protein [Planctomycetota bacterium]